MFFRIAGTFEAEALKLAEIECALYKVSAKKLVSDVVPFLIDYTRYYAGWAGMSYPNSKQLKPQGIK